MTNAHSVSYHFAILRVVPHVHLGAFINVGVVLHSRTMEYLAMRAIEEPRSLRTLAPDVDAELLARYLACYRGICAGDPAAGPIALVSPSERFHWMTSPRSDVLQASPVHEGLGDPATALGELYDALTLAAESR
jgi:Protein of unknown function (DUF3037)